MARIFKRCACPEDQWENCPHPWVVRYRTTSGRSSRQREQVAAGLPADWAVTVWLMHGCGLRIGEPQRRAGKRC